jgi:hypothetical protein
MADVDRVFARFKDDKPEPTNRRETLSIPRRSGAGGSRTVEVVHLRSGRGATDRPQRLDSRVRAASWDGGFQAKRPIATPVLPTPVSVPVIAPTTHVMPAWDPAVTEEASSAQGLRLRLKRLMSRHAAAEDGRARRSPQRRPPSALQTRLTLMTTARTACAAAMRSSQRGRSAGC